MNDPKVKVFDEIYKPPKSFGWLIYKQQTSLCDLNH